MSTNRSPFPEIYNYLSMNIIIKSISPESLLYLVDTFLKVIWMFSASYAGYMLNFYEKIAFFLFSHVSVTFLYKWALLFTVFCFLFREG